MAHSCSVAFRLLSLLLLLQQKLFIYSRDHLFGVIGEEDDYRRSAEK